jgi:hypothetical protein
MPQYEFFSRLIGALCDAALAGVDSMCRVITYEMLTPEKMVEIGDFFGVELRDQREAILNLFGTYSKDPSQTRRFAKDTDRKLSSATEPIRRSVDGWARRSYERLRMLA